MWRFNQTHKSNNCQPSSALLQGANVCHPSLITCAEYKRQQIIHCRAPTPTFVHKPRKTPSSHPALCSCPVQPSELGSWCPSSTHFGEAHLEQLDPFQELREIPAVTPLCASHQHKVRWEKLCRDKHTPEGHILAYPWGCILKSKQTRY